MAADKVLPPLLFAILPQASRRHPINSSNGGAISIHHATEGAPLRGMLALLLRSIAAADTGLNVSFLANDPQRRQVPLSMVHSSRSHSVFMSFQYFCFACNADVCIVMDNLLCMSCRTNKDKHFQQASIRILKLEKVEWLF